MVVAVPLFLAPPVIIPLVEAAGTLEETVQGQLVMVMVVAEETV